MPQPHIAAKTVSVKLDVDTRARVESLALARHRSAHWVMREAITQYVEREERREAFRQDTLKAWEEYQETGTHAKAAEVDDWLASWGTEDEVLGQQPQIGRPVPDMEAQFREWPIDFGDSGYVARCRFDGNAVVILAVRHQKEAGYR